MKNLKKTVLFTAALIISSSACFGIFGKKTTTEDAGVKLDLPPYSGIKHAIGVAPFENDSYWKGDIDLQENMTIMLENVLNESGRFVVVKRSDLDAILNEQDLQSGGRAAKARDVAQTGKIRSARYLASCRVMSVEANESGSTGAFKIKGVRIGASGGKAQIQINVDIFDSTTSEILASKQIIGKAGKRGFTLGYSEGGFGGDIGGFSKTPIGEAAYDCVVSAVEFMAHEFEDYDLEVAVVAVLGDGQVLVSIGENYGASVGDRFQVREVGEEIIGPDGSILGRVEGSVTCTIEITRVADKMSYCKIVTGELPVVGDAAIAL